MYSLDPRHNEWVNNSTIYSWRQYLKRELLRQRGWVSDFSGKSLMTGCEMHEGIVTRANVPKTVHWHYLIYHPYNSFLLTPEEHRPKAPSREWCIQKAYDLYGHDEVVSWYYSLPFKVYPFKLL